MKIRVLGAFGGEGLGHRPSAFLVNDRTLLDAGTVSALDTVPASISVRSLIRNAEGRCPSPSPPKAPSTRNFIPSQY